MLRVSLTDTLLELMDQALATVVFHLLVMPFVEFVFEFMDLNRLLARLDIFLICGFGRCMGLGSSRFR